MGIFATGLPLNRGIQVVVASVARTDTAAKNLFVLPDGAVPLLFYIFTAVASNAATTATVSVGKPGSGTFFLNTVDVKTSAGLLVPPSAKVTNLVSGQIGDTMVTGIYAETGTASTAGGPFYVMCMYVTTGPGDITSTGVFTN